MSKNDNSKDIVIYQSKNGSIRIKHDARKETIWLTQLQVADLFNVGKAAISKHVKNIFETGELKASSTVSKMEIVQVEGDREVRRNIEHYNLDLVLSIGYRVNSMQATSFRKWATKVLRWHIVDGYTLNKQTIKDNYGQFFDAVLLIALPAAMAWVVRGRQGINHYASKALLIAIIGVALLIIGLEIATIGNLLPSLV